MPNYKTIFADLKDQPYNTFDGVHYGIPHGRGANLLMWNTDDVKPAPTSWDVILDPKKAAKYKGKISAYDDSIYIADAAVYLKTHQPDLGIENPYELNDRAVRRGGRPAQGAAAERRRVLVDATKQISAFANGDDQVGTTWQYQYFALKADGQAGGGEPGEPGLRAQGGRDRLVGHLDDQLQGQASELHVQVDELHRLAEGQRRGGGVLRRGAGAEQGRATTDHRRIGSPTSSATSTTQRTRRSGSGSTTGSRRWPIAATTAKTDCKDYNDWVQAWTDDQGVMPASPRTTDEASMEAADALAPAPKRSAGRRLADLFHGRPRLQVGPLLAGPLGWLVIGYLGSLAVLLVAAFWSVDALSGELTETFSLDNFKTLIDDPVYRDVAERTILDRGGW